MSDFKNPLERWVAKMLMKIDKYARPSKASGASTENYDIQTMIPIAVEAKMRSIKNPVINMVTWKKLLDEIPMRSDRTPVLFLENMYGDRFAVLKAQDFFNEFLYELYEEEK